MKVKCEKYIDVIKNNDLEIDTDKLLMFFCKKIKVLNLFLIVGNKKMSRKFTENNREY